MCVGACHTTNKTSRCFIIVGEPEQVGPAFEQPSFAGLEVQYYDNIRGGRATVSTLTELVAKGSS